MEEADIKFWKDAGHVARRTIEGIKGEIVAGKSWDDLIDSAERFIRRHGGTPAFPVTISVNDIAAHYTTNSILTKPEGLEEEMVFEKGDLVKLDVGVHIKGALADNALTVEVGGGGDHTDQIRAAKEARDAQIEAMTPGSTWAEIGAVADQVHTDAGFQPVTNLCGHKMEEWNLHAGVSVPSYDCGKTNQSFKGGPEVGAFYAIEPFNTTGKSGKIEDIQPSTSSNIHRVTGNITVRKAVAKKKLKPLGATMARYIEERYLSLIHI